VLAANTLDSLARSARSRGDTDEALAIEARLAASTG